MSKFTVVATPSGCEMEVRDEVDTLKEAVAKAEAIKDKNEDKADYQIDIFKTSDWRKWEESQYAEEKFTDPIQSLGSNSDAEWACW